MIAFSTEKLSVGSPAIFQERILTESPRMWTKENCSEHGIPRDLTCWKGKEEEEQKKEEQHEEEDQKGKKWKI